MNGIIAIAGYVPHHRLQRSRIAEVLGGQAASGTRAVASYDEDTTTMAVAAARHVFATTDRRPESVWFSTATPAYLDKTNATAIHAALRLDRTIPAVDMVGSPRSGMGALLAATNSSAPTLVVAADMRTGLPRSGDERDGGDGAAAVLVGSDDKAVIAEVLATATLTEEFLDRWRVPGEVRTKAWEERFGETRYVPLATEVAKAALADADIASADVVIVTGMHSRAVSRSLQSLATDNAADHLLDSVGNTGTPHPLLVLANVLEGAAPDTTILLVSLADGADAIVLRTTPAITQWHPVNTVAVQVAAGDDTLPYADFLAWRGMITPEPPRRPEPARVSASAAGRATDWKFGFVGSADEAGTIHLPPSTISMRSGDQEQMQPAPMADTPATVTTFTVDRLAWSPSPPTIFAVLDFDGGGRFACEVTDCGPDAIAIGDRVEMTFRVLNEADGIRNYFWKAKPRREMG